MSESNHQHTCPNCGRDPGIGKFCAECGQKNRPTKLNLRTIFGELFSILFNLDNQFFRTLGAALIPGKLATEFVKGKRKTYLHPLRFFFYSWIFLALLMNWSITDNSNTSSKKEEILDSILKLNIGSNEISLNKKSIDSLTKVFKRKDLNIDFGIGTNLKFTSDSSKLLPPTDTLKTILFSDLDQLEKDSLYQKYNITSWFDKFKIERAKRFDAGFTDIFQYMLDHFIWLFFAVIPFSALWLWLLFGRSKKYYAEHILYLLYLFSVLFIFIILSIIANYLPEEVSNLAFVTLWLGFSAYSYFSLKNYYGQGHLKTFFKWNAYLLINFLLFVIFTVFFSILSAALF